ncbi:type I-F CRISPR-associated protein Csy3 [Endozoicomonas sp. SM1973]|uniref:Type I-F CRISPR-associated protein Csy3 n=1 Tax=Spartinivicinus marinus TaxID=2994442 RepID=A0A853IFB8_9GAMM|nr:type I-F CRISPR-associated protein Csy3 [Spartinivicinus marinus]MCX4030212.1 type I-F CRISPR-associated protein Csy3 [Spartinivicinus marinus]NYZ67855.1 type I-F CRISPR-associated protein Csy3 [Spartinivicinus marinus]
MAKFELPTMLNYTRSIIPSNGVFTCLTNEEKELPVFVTSQTVRGTISNYAGIGRSGKTSDNEQVKLLDINNANIKAIDVCYLPENASVFKLKFSLTFAGHSSAPGACNNPDYFEQLESFAALYKEKNGYTELAKRYLTNIINGRWMWRNRYATNKQVAIQLNETTFVFDVNSALDTDYSDYEGFGELTQQISQSLSDTTPPLRLQVSGTGNLGFGQEVYPSQEFVDSKENKKGKVLASQLYGNTGQRQATMHSQKIGNAIRTIDTWHKKADSYGAIAVEPYGVVQQRAEAVRLPSNKDDLYHHLTYLTALIESLQSEEAIADSAHYVMACLIRGGVFSGESKKDKKK